MKTKYQREYWESVSPKTMSYQQQCDLYDGYFDLLHTAERLQEGLQHVILTADQNRPDCNKIERMKYIAQLTHDGEWPVAEEEKKRQINELFEVDLETFESNQNKNKK